MARYRVFMTGHADASVDMEIDDPHLDDIMARTNGGRNLAFAEGDAVSAVIENAVWDNDPDTPRVCAQCSGWGQSYSLEVGDEWEVVGIELADDE